MRLLNLESSFGFQSFVLESRDNDLPKKVYYLFGKKWKGGKFLLATSLVQELKRFVRKRREAIDQAFYSGSSARTRGVIK